MHAKEDEKDKLKYLMLQIKKPEINESNDLEQRKKMILATKRKFFALLTSEYLLKEVS